MEEAESRLKGPRVNRLESPMALFSGFRMIGRFWLPPRLDGRILISEGG